MKRILPFIAVLILPVILFAQNTGKISGVVTDDAGNPLPGTNVMVVGTMLGAATDAMGRYEIVNVPPGTYEVKATFIGYQESILPDIQVTVGGSVELNFSLSMSVYMGKQVVVIGYGTQEKKDLTGSVTSVRMKDVTKISATEASTAIQGRAAGVNVSQESGAPGAGAEIKIRGVGTLGGSGSFPLVIVDGVPSAMGSVDPNDIESIDILKDASAAAIYGSRAGNGVIIITTKRGETGPIKIDFSTKLSSHSLPNRFDLVTDGDEYIRIVKQANDNAGTDYPDFVSMYESNDPRISRGTDWQDAYFRSALLQDYNLTLSGGSENLKFSVSGNYSNQEGIVVTTFDERMGLRVNADFTKGKLKIGESFSISRQTGKGRYNARYAFFDLGGMSPLVPLKNPDNPTGWGGQDPDFGFYREIDNIVAHAYLRDNKYDNLHALASAYVEFTPFEGLTYTGRLSQNIYADYDYEFNPQFSLSRLDMNEVSNMEEERSRTYHTVMDHTLNYKAETGNHSVDAMVGYSQESRNYRRTWGSVADFPDNDLRVLGAGRADDDAWGWEEQWNVRSFFGRINYAFAGKYLLQANIRRDGSSRFSEESRWGNFPSMSLGWRVSEESFFKVPFITEFKIRGSYGVLGMQEFDDEYLTSYLIEFDNNETLNYPFGPGKEQGVAVGGRAVNFASIGLKWEESKQTNIGFDMRMLNDKLSLEFDYYIKKNEGVLYNPPIPYSAGSSEPPWINAASVENNGIELAINYRNLENALKYEMSFTFTKNNNKVTQLGRQGTEAIWGDDVYWAFDNMTKTIVGQEIGAFYLYETDGIFKTQAELDAYNAAVTEYVTDVTPGLGDVKYVDRNGDGVINDDDKKFFNSAQPKAEFGYNLNLSYKRFDFNMFLYAVVGKNMYNGAKMLSYWTNHPAGNYHTDYLDAWSPTNTDSDIPRVIQDDDRNVQASDLFLEDASYLKLRHIEVGYTVPPELIVSAGVQSLRIYVAAENLLTLTGYSGYDPSIDYGNKFSRGIDRAPYPVPRQIMTGIQIGL